MVSSFTDIARGISAWCPDYPRELCDLADAPCVFRVAGQLPERHSRISIVGTRRADDEALEFAYDLGRHAALRGVVVVSGGAVGVDRAAHEGAIDAGGATIVVLPTGLDAPYPPANRDLFARAVEAGCLLTEVDDGSDARKGRFLTRNRLVAALGRATVVVQAPARSGALSTARIARRLGRGVFAVPSSPWNPRGLGGLRLLGEGARICAGPADVLSESAPRGGGPSAESPSDELKLSDFKDLTDSQHTILRHLSGRARHPDEICRSAGIPAFQVQQSILGLLVRGLVEEKPGGRYRSCLAGRKPY